MRSPINTDRELQALKPEVARYERAITKARGLSVLVYPNGCKAFVVRYAAPNGARRRLALGDYPALSLAMARLKAGVLRLEVVEGGDPAGTRQTARHEAKTGETLEQLAAGYWKAAAIGIHGGRRHPLRASTIERQKGLWKKHLKPVVGAHRYKELKRADIRAFMEGLVEAGRLSPSSIASIGDVLRALFAYALHRDLVEANPALGLTRPIAPRSRSRLFTDAALCGLLGLLDDASCAEEGRCDPHARMAPQMALGLRFLILTLTRRTETAGTRWLEIDEATRTWTIPGARTKNRQDHVVPLSPQAIEVLRRVRRLPGAQGDGFVFPSPTKAGAHLDPHAMTRAVSRMCARLELPPGSPHDMRRTAATMLTSERYGFRRFVVGKVLGHTVQDGAAVTAVYDRNEYLPEKRQALEAWGRHVEGLTPPRDGEGPTSSQSPRLRLVTNG
ncbi:integrase arm-type DNA-binding domain-containing protein [Phenylobacterium sp.]|uniref:tyrosine-type recombinase/integrase n=1 Tax=Phenylobacterium sp. TaxID=1871053 RepID=UPI00286BD521|nr:integrase arm-type DNA-binding domain-containing protein [Phenylobacterium sp.]